MTTNILIAIISLIGTIAGSIIGAISASKLVNYRINILEQKVNKFDDLVERISLVELKVNEKDSCIKDNYE